MENTLEGVLTIKDKDGTLLAILFNDFKKRSQVFYSCKEMGAEDLKQLLDKMVAKE